MDDHRSTVRVGVVPPANAAGPGRPAGRQRRPGAEARGWHDGGRYDRPCRSVVSGDRRARRRDHLRPAACLSPADPAAGDRRGHRAALRSGRVHPRRDRVPAAPGDHRGADPPARPADPGGGHRSGRRGRHRPTRPAPSTAALRRPARSTSRARAVAPFDDDQGARTARRRADP